ncbi:hypothetical protein [Ammoniphilus sp. 3BR4]|uniref:hypothetical protein n=1 Tax=Ammoniphilus sp. 3BR4 TaxID=3158265 RepID=UPI003464F963
MSKKYSTGPIENEGAPGTTIAQTIFVKVYNDGDDRARVRIKVYALNGEKDRIAKETINVRGESSGFVVVDVSNAFQYVVEFKVERGKDVELSVFPKDANNSLIAAQRVLHSELKRV